MPGSMPEGKAFIKRFLLDKQVRRVLDVGPGSGNYFDLLNTRGEYRSLEPTTVFTDCEWVAVEIWGPYIDFFGLHEKYSKIIVRDIYDYEWDSRFDVVFLGDVLEHMPEDRGREVIRKAVEHSNWVVISLPIVDCPQDASYGNKYEMHVEQYSPEKMQRLLEGYNIVSSQEGKIIGVYILG